jgi:hypothetical protein
MITPIRMPEPTPQERASQALCIISNSVSRLPGLLNRLVGVIDRLASAAQYEQKDKP